MPNIWQALKSRKNKPQTTRQGGKGQKTMNMLWNLRNFKKGLKLVEKIAKSNDIREVDFATGYAIASVAQMKKQGKITQAQRKALEDLIYNTADDTAKEIKENSGSLYTEENEVLAELVEMQ